MSHDGDVDWKNTQNLKAESYLLFRGNFSVGKESACNAGDPGSNPVSERSPGEGKGYPLQCSGLKNSLDCIVHGVAKSPTQLSDFHFQSTVFSLKQSEGTKTLLEEI